MGCIQTPSHSSRFVVDYHLHSCFSHFDIKCYLSPVCFLSTLADSRFLGLQNGSHSTSRPSGRLCRMSKQPYARIRYPLQNHVQRSLSPVSKSRSPSPDHRLQWHCRNYKNREEGVSGL